MALDPPDLVISFSPSNPSAQLPKSVAASLDSSRDAARQAAVQQYGVLLDRLRSRGLLVTSRKATKGHGGEEGKVWVLVRAPASVVDELRVKERADDFLHGVTTSPTAPGAATDPATRLRLVYDLLTNAIEQGGLAITPNAYPWSHVTAIFALHDHAADKRWITQWTQQDWKAGLGPTQTDTANLAAQHGPALALYFAFLSTYTLALVPLAVLSTVAHFLLPAYSLAYALPASLWALAFVEFWRAKERVLAGELGTEGIDGKPKLRARSSPMAAEEAWWRRSARVAAGVPVLLLCALFLAGVLTLLFMGEAFVANLYSGFGEKYIGLVPTVCFSLIVPQILKAYRAIAERLTAFEDHASTAAHADALTRKTFALSSIVAYAGLALSAFVYIPFGRGIMLGVDEKVYRRAAGTESKLADKASGKVDRAARAKGVINKGRLQDQLFAYTVTNQLVNAFLELCLPVILRKVAEYRGQVSDGKSPTATRPSAPSGAQASPAAGQEKEGKETEDEVAIDEDERRLIEAIEKEAALPSYDLFTDYSEMVTQFGYVALWSVCWPLAAFSSLVNNYFELRADALKIVHNVQRPIPIRTASIGPWLDALSVLAQLSAVTSITLHLLFHPHELRLRFVPAAAQRFVSPSYDPSGADDASTSVAETVFPLVLTGLAAAQLAALVQRALAYVMNQVVWEGSEAHQVSVQKTLAVRRAHLEEQQHTVGQRSQAEQADRPEAVSPFWQGTGVDAVEVGQGFKTE